MILSAVNHYFGLLSVIAFSKTKRNYAYYILGSHVNNKGRGQKKNTHPATQWPLKDGGFPVRTAQSQHPNVYTQYKFPLDGMRIVVIRYEPRTLYLRPCKFFFQQLRSCFIK